MTLEIVKTPRSVSYYRGRLSEASFPRAETTLIIELDSRGGSLGFPVLELSAWLHDPDQVADKICALLTEHFQD